MKTVFFGTPPFAAQVLERLIAEGVNVVGVISKPDRPKGRSSKPVPTAVREVAERHHLPLFQPQKVSDPEFIPILASLDADLYVVVAYGEIVKENVLSLPHKACINLHASLLPRYRGAAPIQHAVICGEEKTGVTIIHMAKKMDAGDILAAAELSIGQEETFGEVQERLCALGGETLLNVIGAFEKNVPVAIPQDHQLATFAPKIELEDCEIDWLKPAQEIHDLIRGVNPYPGAWTRVSLRGEERRLKIYSSKVTNGDQAVAKKLLFVDNLPVIACGEGTFLSLGSVQLEGKKRMDASDLFRGICKEEFEIL